MNIRYLQSQLQIFKATEFTTETKEEVIRMTAFNKAPKLKIRRQMLYGFHLKQKAEWWLSGVGVIGNVMGAMGIEFQLSDEKSSGDGW